MTAAAREERLLNGLPLSEGQAFTLRLVSIPYEASSPEQKSLRR